MTNKSWCGYACVLAGLLCPPLFAQTAQQAVEQRVPISLAISGGISLGSYEAGLNWAVMRQLKYVREHPEQRSDKFPPALTAVAGASAGGINALVSAMSWCMDDARMQGVAHDTVDQNLFRDIWLDVGFNNLLPENPAEYDPDDGLLSRRAFDQVIDRISQLLDKKIYRDECHIPVALTVTRTEPVVISVDGIEVRNQRFVIPFVLKASGDGGLKLESYLVDHTNPMLGNVIYLRANNADGVRLDKQRVIDAVLASSAFPVAFGRVHLQYCLRAEFSETTTALRGNCPQGHVEATGDFVDGGVFDNVPLGVAKALAEAQPKHPDVEYSYIYLDPGSRRPEDIKRSQSLMMQRSLGYGLSSQLSFLSGAIASGEEYELYSVLRNPDWADKKMRRILLTSRNPPITGEFLAHFGAFIDEPFREYDYYAGVYDAILNIARYRCSRMNSDVSPTDICHARESRKIYDILLGEVVSEKELTLTKAILAELARYEHENTVLVSEWQWMWQGTPDKLQSNALLVATTLLDVARENPASEPELKEFMLKLPHEYDASHSSFVMRRMLKLRREDELKWFYPLASRASIRLLELEKREQQLTGDSMRGLMGVAAFGVETALGDRDEFVWNQSTALDSDYQWIPYEISYDVLNTGWSVSWEPSWMFSRPWMLNAKITPFAYQYADQSRVEFSQVDFLIAHKNESSFFSSWGAGISYNHITEIDVARDKNNFGVVAFAGFFGDKLRLTLGRRAESDTIYGDEIYLYFGLTDLPGITYWTRRTYW